jgi:hypothetical protein
MSRLGSTQIPTYVPSERWPDYKWNPSRSISYASTIVAMTEPYDPVPTE